MTCRNNQSGNITDTIERATKTIMISISTAIIAISIVIGITENKGHARIERKAKEPPQMNNTVICTISDMSTEFDSSSQ